MDIKVLGPGCKKCQALEEEVREVVEEMGIEAKIEKVTDLKEITNYNIFITPGLVVNGRVVVSGHIPRRDEIKKWLQEQA